MLLAACQHSLMAGIATTSYNLHCQIVIACAYLLRYYLFFHSINSHTKRPRFFSLSSSGHYY